MQAKTKEQTQSAEQSFHLPRTDSFQVKLSPHFFFNVLNSIYHSIRLNADQAEDILINFSELIQYHVYDCLSHEIALESKLQTLFSAKHQLRIDTTNKICSTFLQIPLS